jgi:mannose-6-phosphate isomerase-like protein (cupin superfamily)
MRVGDGESFDIGPGDTVTIPQNTAQSVANTGDSDLVFLCLCTPRFLQDCYTSLE